MKFIVSSIVLCGILIIACASNEKNQDDTFKESLARGQIIYEDFCVVCHQTNGEGIENAFPPLAKSDYLSANRKESIKAVKFGRTGEITVNGKTYNNAMAPLGLYNEEVADVMNYITNSWGNKNNKIFTVEEVAKLGE